MPGDLLIELSRFGAAGLIGVLWVLERRHAAQRDRQLDEAHRRIIEHRQKADTLLDVVKDNTRAIVSLEAGQRRLADLIRSLMDGKK